MEYEFDLPVHSVLIAQEAAWVVTTDSLDFVCVEETEEEAEMTVEADLTEKQKHQLKHRELFLSRQYESLPATHIRWDL